MTPIAGTAVAIAGAGLIGVSWAALLLHHGAAVSVWDPSPEALTALPARMAGPLEQLARLGPRAERGRLTVSPDLAAAVAGAALVQENAPEDLALKHALYAEIEAAAPADALIASSTSALTWSALAPGLRDPRRFLTAHPFNPPHLVPLVELFAPEPATLDRAEALYRAAGRHPVRMRRDLPGHLANRLASALWREAVHLVAEGVADVAAVDAALTHGPGLRWSVMGAHMAYHLGGGAGGMAGYLAHLGASQERRWATLGAPMLDDRARRALIEGVAQEAAGRDIAALEQARDEALIAVLLARRAAPPL